MAKGSSSRAVVWVGLAADVLVAAVKIGAALFTGNAGMAAEGAHSLVDVGSGGLMLYGYRRSQQGPNRAIHSDMGANSTSGASWLRFCSSRSASAFRSTRARSGSSTRPSSTPRS